MHLCMRNVSAVATKVKGSNKPQIAVDTFGEKFRAAVDKDGSQISDTADKVCMRQVGTLSSSRPTTIEKQSSMLNSCTTVGWDRELLSSSRNLELRQQRDNLTPTTRYAL